MPTHLLSVQCTLSSWGCPGTVGWAVQVWWAVQIQVVVLHGLPSWEGSEANGNSSNVICRDLAWICSHLEAPALTEAGEVVARLGPAKSQSLSWGWYWAAQPLHQPKGFKWLELEAAWGGILRWEYFKCSVYTIAGGSVEELLIDWCHCGLDWKLCSKVVVSWNVRLQELSFCLVLMLPWFVLVQMQC